MTQGHDANLHRIPFLAPGVKGVPTDETEKEFRFHNNGEPLPIVIGAAALQIAEEFDGVRTCAQIFEELRREGAPIPSAGFVTALATALVNTPLALFLDEPLETPYRRYLPRHVESLGALNHQCFGCGRSCQGHVIGPLDDDYLQRAESIHASLSAELPELAGLPAVRTVFEEQGRSHQALPMRGGQCAYLDDDNLCQIHKKLGAEAKPLRCRIFPLTIIQTESAIRIGTPLRCYFAHESFDHTTSATPVTATGVSSDNFPKPGQRGADPSDPHRVVLNPRPDTDYYRTIRDEATLLALLGGEHSLERLILSLYMLTFQRALDSMPGDLILQTGFGEALVAGLNRLGAQLISADPFAAEDAAPGTHPRLMWALGRQLEGLTRRPMPRLNARQLQFAAYTLREDIYMREWVLQRSLHESALMGLIGALVAGWAAEDVGYSDAEHIGEPFAWTLTCWSRALRIGASFDQVLPDHDAFITLLGGLNSHAGEAAP